jgi:hypothetical protein
MIRRTLRALYMVGVTTIGLWLLAALAVAVGYHVWLRDGR